MAATYDVIVIGEGVAGLTAAGELARAGLKVATLEAQLFGGLVLNINELDPPPEGSEGGSGNSGAEYASTLMQANADAGVTSISESVSRIEISGDLKKIVTDSGAYTAKQVVVASGARLKKLGVPARTGLGPGAQTRWIAHRAKKPHRPAPAADRRGPPPGR